MGGWVAWLRDCVRACVRARVRACARGLAVGWVGGRLSGCTVDGMMRDEDDDVKGRFLSKFPGALKMSDWHGAQQTVKTMK